MKIRDSTRQVEKWRVEKWWAGCWVAKDPHRIHSRVCATHAEAFAYADQKARAAYKLATVTDIPTH